MPTYDRIRATIASIRLDAWHFPANVTFPGQTAPAISYAASGRNGQFPLKQEAHDVLGFGHTRQRSATAPIHRPEPIVPVPCPPLLAVPYNPASATRGELDTPTDVPVANGGTPRNQNFWAGLEGSQVTPEPKNANHFWNERPADFGMPDNHIQ